MSVLRYSARLGSISAEEPLICASAWFKACAARIGSGFRIRSVGFVRCHEIAMKPALNLQCVRTREASPLQLGATPSLH